MYSSSKQSRCFWNRYNITWPCRQEPSSGWTVPTTAVCSELRYQVIWTYLYQQTFPCHHASITCQIPITRQPLPSYRARKSVWFLCIFIKIIRINKCMYCFTQCLSHIQFQGDTQNSAANVSTSLVCNDTMLVFLKTGSWNIRRWGGLEWSDVNTRFHKSCLWYPCP